MKRSELGVLVLLSACTSEQVIQGTDGNSGSDGLDCWDLDGNGMADESEDINGDGNVDVLDCQGAPGQDGADGQDCWDLNANGEPDPEEDLNGDGAVNVEDCQGFEDNDTGTGGDTGELLTSRTDYFGDISFTSREAMSAFCELHDVIWGNVYIMSEDFGLTDTDSLACLEYIDGTLYIHGSVLESARFESLTGLGNLYITSVNALQSIHIPQLEEIRGHLHIYYAPLLTEAVLSNLRSTQERFYLQTTAIRDMDGFSSLQTVGGYLLLDNNDSLTDISGLMAMTSVGEYLWVTDNDELPDVDVTALIESIGKGNIGGEIYTWGNGG